jgi:hypothetical protein
MVLSLKYIGLCMPLLAIAIKNLAIGGTPGTSWTDGAYGTHWTGGAGGARNTLRSLWSLRARGSVDTLSAGRTHAPDLGPGNRMFVRCARGGGQPEGAGVGEAGGDYLAHHWVRITGEGIHPQSRHDQRSGDRTGKQATAPFPEATLPLAVQGLGLLGAQCANLCSESNELGGELLL